MLVLVLLPAQYPWPFLSLVPPRSHPCIQLLGHRYTHPTVCPRMIPPPKRRSDLQQMGTLPVNAPVLHHRRQMRHGSTPIIVNITDPE